MTNSFGSIKPLIWHGDAQTGWLEMLDQTQLPTTQTSVHCRSTEGV